MPDVDKSRRPFPWRCSECRQKTVEGAVISYTGQVKHDGRSYDVIVPALDAARCRNCGAVVLDDLAGEQIADALRNQVGVLTPDQIRAGIGALSVNQKQLAANLGIAEATLSRWCTGTLIQSRAMDRLLRGYFASPELREVLGCLDRDPRVGSVVTIRPDDVS